MYVDGDLRETDTGNQGSDTRVIPQKPTGFWVKPGEKNPQKHAPNLIQFQFLMPVTIKESTNKLPTACSNKKSKNPIKLKTNKTPKTQLVGLF